MLSRLSVLAFVVFLAACGFTPMYGDYSKNAPKELAQVDIEIIPNAEGVYLRNLLIDHFYEDGYPKSPAYKLSVAPLTENISDLDITSDSEATRQQIKLSTAINLVDIKAGSTVLSRPIYALTSFNVLDSQFTTRTSEQDAREAALSELARQIETQLMLYFTR